MSIRTVGTLLALTGALVGCAAEEQKPTVLPPAPSVSASASPTPVAPLPVPPEAQEATSQGASAFARYYLDVIGQALQTADATQLESLSDPGCQGCQNFIGAVKGAKMAGEVSSGGAFDVLFAASPALRDGETVTSLRYTRRAATIVNDFGVVITELPPDEPLDALIRLHHQSGSWIVRGFRATPVSS